MIKPKKIIAVVLSVSFVITLSSCKNNTDNISSKLDDMSDSLDNIVYALSGEMPENSEDLYESEETIVYTEDETDIEESTVSSSNDEIITKKNDKVTEKTTVKKTNSKIKLIGGLSSNDVSEVLQYFKLVARKNSQVKMKKTLSFISIDVGNVYINGKTEPIDGKKAEGYFVPLAKLALKLSSETLTWQGKPQSIKVSDWKSAKAVNDGKYTTLTINVFPQKDGPYADEYDGPVGRSMRVLAGFGIAVDKLSGVSCDFDNGEVYIEYLNPKIVLKVDNATGELVKDSCTWYYRTHTVLNKLNGQFSKYKVKLEGSHGYVDYLVKY